MNKGLTGHMPALGVLLIVHGSLMLLMGLMIILAGAAVIVGGLSGGEEVPPLIGAGCCYFFMFLCAAVGGGLQIAGGINAYRWKNHGLVKTAIFASIAGIFTCYCWMTSVGLLIWGLIVIHDQAVKDKFAAPDVPEYPPPPGDTGYYA
jgi:hypothetical protein